MEEERERAKGRAKGRRETDEPDVEAHRSKAYGEGSEAEQEPGRRAGDEDEPDVEAHRFKS